MTAKRKLLAAALGRSCRPGAVVANPAGIASAHG